MSGRRDSGRREFLRLSAVATSASLVAACLPGQEAAPTQQPTAGRFRLGTIEGSVLVTDTARYPKTFNEAPELAQMVREGRLPPVQERIGQDPLVLQPLHEAGAYGGTIRRTFIGPADRQNANRFASGPDRLLYWDYEWKRVTPWLAKGFELSADGRTLTLELRRGMRWSDGSAFTADDIVFWYEDIYLDPTLVATKEATLQVNQKDVVIRKVDTYTVRYESPDPNPLLPELLAGTTSLGGLAAFGGLLLGGYAPSEYLKKIHPKHNPAGSEAERTRGNFATTRLMLMKLLEWTENPDLPVLTPWKVRKGNDILTSNWILERNPYYVGVDTAGNQLPYVSSLQHTVGANLEVINLRAVAGEYDFQDRHLNAVSLPLLLENQDRSGYRVYPDPSEENVGININLSYVADPEVGELLRTADFRRALSIGIDRDQINESFFLGATMPSSNAPAPTNRYSPGEEANRRWATHDVAQANRLLDGLGYTAKDAEGYRLRRDNGQRLRLEIQSISGSTADFPGMSEMVKRHWIDIGVDVNVQSVSTSLFVPRMRSNQVQMTIHVVGSDDLFVFSQIAFPSSLGGISMSIENARWFLSNGTQGREPFADLKDLMELWRRGYAAPEAERIRIGKEWWTKASDICLQIGFITRDLSGMHYAKTNLRNVPTRMTNSNTLNTPVIGLPQTFFYK